MSVHCVGLQPATEYVETLVEQTNISAHSPRPYSSFASQP